MIAQQGMAWTDGLSETLECYTDSFLNTQNLQNFASTPRLRDISGH